MHKSNAINQVHELAPPTCVLPLSKNFDPPLFFNVAPIWSMSMLALSSPLYLFFLTFHIFVQISPPLSSMTLKGPRPYEIWVMWILMDTARKFYHKNLLWLDAKSWTWVDGWVLNLHFWWTLSIWLELTPLVTTTCGSMKTTLKCHTCRILVGSLILIPCSGAPPPMSKCLSIYLNLELFLMRVAFLIWIDHLQLRITCGTTIVGLDPLEWIPLIWPCISLVEIPWYTFCWI